MPTTVKSKEQIKQNNGREVFNIAIQDIVVGERLRSEQSTESLELSMRLDGLKTPITVFHNPDFVSLEETPEEAPYQLILGFHRLQTALNLGWETISCFIKEGIDELEAERLEIFENLTCNKLIEAEKLVQFIRLSEIYNKTNKIIAGEAITELSKTGEIFSAEKPERAYEKMAREYGIDIKILTQENIALGKKLDVKAVANVAHTPIGYSKSELQRLSKFDKYTQQAISEIAKEEFNSGNKLITVYEANRILNDDPILKPGRVRHSPQSKFFIGLDVIAGEAEEIGVDWTNGVKKLESVLKDLDLDTCWKLPNIKANRMKLDTVLASIDMLSNLVPIITKMRNEFSDVENKKQAG